jgi:hypothetical protein
MLAVDVKKKLIQWCDERGNCTDCPFDHPNAWCDKPISTRFTIAKLRELCTIAGIKLDDDE